jgi:flagellar biosynthesis/type III secretory pathway protein FliH
LSNGPIGKTFKAVDIGSGITLSDEYLNINHSHLRQDALAQQTLEAAMEEAATMIAFARAEAEQIIQHARQQAVEVTEAEKQAVLDQGHQEGFDQGCLDAGAAVSQYVTSAESIVALAIDAQKRLFAKQKETLATLLHHIVKQTLQHEIQATPQHLLRCIEVAVNTLHSEGAVHIALNPDTLKLLKELAPDLQTAQLMLKSDPMCGPYELYLETAEAEYNISPEAMARVYLETALPLLTPLLNEEPPADALD